LISTKNSREGTQHLLSVSNSTHLIADSNFHSYAQSLELAIPIVPFLEIPEFTGECESVDYQKITEAEREIERKLPAFYLHTSGSTGHPKLIGQVCFVH
jgi:acyl-coenzyme A synthetase/AMP-(fatty) acid ligase